MLARWDEAILDRTQAVCHRIQRFCGITNFDLARVAFVASMTIVSMMFLVLPSLPDWHMAAAVGFAGLMYLKIFSDWYQEMEAYYALPHDAAHWRTLAWREQVGARSFSALLTLAAVLGAVVHMVPVASGALFFGAAMLFRLASLYLHCLVPLPPGVSKIQEWRESFQAGLRRRIPLPTRH